MSIVIDIADAVMAELNSGTFSKAVTAVRRVLPRFELEDLIELKVSVVPRTSNISNASRSTSQHEIEIDIGIQQKVQDINVEVPQLGLLVDEIEAFIRKRPLASTPWAHWTSTQNDPVYDPGHLDQHRVFTSVLSVTYKLFQ